MSKRRVVITGMGVTSPVSSGVDKFWNALKNGQSGIHKVDHFDASAFDAQICGRVKDYEPSDHFNTKEVRNLSRFVQHALVASRQAVTNANIKIEDFDDPYRIGVLIGSGIGSVRSAEEEYQKYLDKGPGRISPFFITKMIINEAAGYVAIDIGSKGPCTCVATACATATNAIGDAMRMIQHDEVDVMVAGGTESATTILGLGGFCSLKALSKRNDEPEKACRPFDANRDGFIMSEGAGIVVIEELEHAKKRGVPILAELVGYGRTCDAYHATAPESTGEGAMKAMEFAIKDAGIKPEDVSYINAHGTSTKLNDKIETLAIKRALGEDVARKVPISSTKSMTGHLLGAAGGVEIISSVMAIRDNIVPPTINYETPDPDCDLDYVPNEARQHETNVVLSNSLGFGGHNATLAVRKYDE